MTTDKEKKRSMFFWKKSHSQNSLGQPTTEVMANGSSQELPAPESTEFVEKDVNVTSVFGPFIKNYVSNLSHNKSPTKLPYPPNFYYPASSLTHQMNLQMHHIDVLLGANTLTSPLDRFLAVLKYSITTCSVTKFPYKPIIAFMGETAQSYATFNDGQNMNSVYYAAEQVEREPSTSAFYISTPDKSVVHTGYVTMDPKFKQAHVTVSFPGQRQTILTHPQGAWTETYTGDVPDLSIKLLRMHTELGGNLNLTCPETGISASIQFRDKPIFGGVKNGITGSVLVNGLEVYQIDGTWDGVTYIIDSASKAKVELLNRTTLPKVKFESMPAEMQPATSGEKEWAPLIDCLHRGDWEQAKVVKAEIDAMHHERRAKYETTPFVTSFFQKTPAGGWEAKDHNSVIFNQNRIGMPTM